MQSINWKSCSQLTCACDGEVIVGVSSELTTDSKPYIEGQIIFVREYIDACTNCKCYIYTISYDETQLVDYTAFTAVNINGVVCKGVLTDYIDAQEPTSPPVGGTGNAWLLEGNDGTVDGTNFLGTTDNVPLTLRVNDLQALRLVPATATEWYTATDIGPNLIGGHRDNTVVAGSGSAVLSGGVAGIGNHITGVTYLNVICGGNDNIITENLNNGAANIIGGGDQHRITNCVSSFIGGGSSHQVVHSTSSAIAGGALNKLTETYVGFIGGGEDNEIECSVSQEQDYYGAIVGGLGNKIYATKAGLNGGNFIGGGNDQIITDCDNSGLLSGQSNYLTDTCAVIAGGLSNEITGQAAGIPGMHVICGGIENRITGNFGYASILGGRDNFIVGTYSSILGGGGLKLGGYSVGYQSPETHTINSIAPLTDLSGFTAIAYFGDTDLWIGNINNTARKLKFFSAQSSSTYAGATYSSMEAQAQAANIEYKLPAAAGSPGQSLKIQGVVGNVVTLQWA